MADRETTKGGLAESLIANSAKGVKHFDTSGIFSSTVKDAEDEKSLFYLKRQWASLCWKCELFEGAEAVGQPVLTLRNGCGLPRCTQSTRLTTATGEPVAELKSHAYVGIKHSFVIDNRRYLWKRTSGWFARRPSYALVEIGNKSDAPLAEYTFGRLRHKGRVSILEAGSHLPPEIVVATALAIEAIWRRCHLARMKAIGGNSSLTASASTPVTGGIGGGTASAASAK